MAQLEFEIIAEGLKFPEGPIVLPDGSVILVEIQRGTLTRVSKGGKTEVIANLGFGGIEAVLMAWAADPTPAHRARLTREVTAFFDRALVAAG